MNGFGSVDETVERLRRHLAARRSPFAIVVLRAPDIPIVAWQRGRPAARALERAVGRAFLSVARRHARAQDSVAHDAGSDCFLLAMLGAARVSTAPIDARAALERMSAAVASATGHTVEGGWSPIEAPADLPDAPSVVARALERGLRERERYQFLAAVGHELRTPLTSIRGYIETVLDEAVQEPAIDVNSARVFLGSALREAHRMSRLVDGMLEFSLLDLSARGSHGQICDASERVRGAMDALCPLATERKASISAAPSRPHLVRIAPDALAHVLVNVLENALKYGRPGGGNVWVGVKRRGAYVAVTIDDDGPGVAESERGTIFAMGVRGAAAIGSGSGIGLAVVRSIVDRAGGRVCVDRSPRGGARFVIHLRKAESGPPAS
ncbi:MAG: sensor histidine kinase [Vulcanimicrobiaceae bacterium]